MHLSLHFLLHLLPHPDDRKRGIRVTLYANPKESSGAKEMIAAMSSLTRAAFIILDRASALHLSQKVRVQGMLQIIKGALFKGSTFPRVWSVRL